MPLPLPRAVCCNLKGQRSQISLYHRMISDAGDQHLGAAEVRSQVPGWSQDESFNSCSMCLSDSGLGKHAWTCQAPMSLKPCTALSSGERLQSTKGQTRTFMRIAILPWKTEKLRSHS